MQPGDTVASVASRFGVDWRQIADLNGLTGPDYMLFFGTVLIIDPPGDGAPAASDSTAETASTAPAPPRTVLVQPGDTLAGVASRFGVDWRQIAELNGLTGPDYMLFFGSVLIIDPPSLDTPDGSESPSDSEALAGPDSPADLESPAGPYSLAGPDSPASADLRTLLVQPGDTLAGVASRFGVDWRQIADLNGLTGPNYVLFFGSLLLIDPPSTGAPATPVSLATPGSTAAPESITALDLSAAPESLTTPDVPAAPDPPAGGSSSEPAPEDAIASLQEFENRFGEPPEATSIRLRIPTIGVDAPLGTRVGGGDGVMQNPAGPTDVVWYDFSDWAGVGGSVGGGNNAILAGHVDYSGYVPYADARFRGPGVFYSLDRLAPGDVIEVEVNGERLIYVVEWQRLVATSEADWASIRSSDLGADSLTLITCGGDFNIASSHYLKRTIVRAQRQ